MIAGLDCDKHRDAEPNLVGVDDGDALLDHALGFQLLDALPAGRRGQTDAIADFSNRERRVLLQHAEDLPVDGVHAKIPQEKKTDFPILAPIQNKFLI